MADLVQSGITSAQIGTTGPINKPAGVVEGTLLILFIMNASSSEYVPSTLAGWTSMLNGTPSTSSSMAYNMMWKIADASDVLAATYTISATGGTMNCVMVALNSTEKFFPTYLFNVSSAAAAPLIATGSLQLRRSPSLVYLFSMQLGVTSNITGQTVTINGVDQVMTEIYAQNFSSSARSELHSYTHSGAHGLSVTAVKATFVASWNAIFAVVISSYNGPESIAKINTTERWRINRIDGLSMEDIKAINTKD